MKKLIAFGLLTTVLGFADTVPQAEVVSLQKESIDDRFPEVFTTGEIPSWVKCVDYAIPKASHSSEVNFQNLLRDTQRNWEERMVYKRAAFKPLTKQGVEWASRWEISCNPAFERITVHAIRLFREGVWEDRLKASRERILHGEKNRSVHTGILNLTYFIPDVRIGDVIEFHYSRSEKNSLRTAYLDDFIDLEPRVSVERIAYRLVAHPSHVLQERSLNTDLTLQVQDLSEDLRQWSVTVFETPERPAGDLEHLPSWFQPSAAIQISECREWKEVSDLLAPLCSLPVDFFTKTPSEIVELVSRWKSSSDDAHKRAELATRFVQDEIRSFVFSEGITAYKPENPITVFQERAGDCKGKSLLLHGLLKLMDISSTLILVNTKIGSTLPHYLPSLRLFDHAILGIELEDETVFVDPILSLQGGPLKENFSPHYAHGLPISESCQGVIQLPRPESKKPNQIHTKISLKDSQTVLVEKQYDYYEQRADAARKSFFHDGYQKMSENYLRNAKTLYLDAKAYTPFQISDNRVLNHIVIQESYLVSLPKSAKRKGVKLPFQLGRMMNIDLNRRTPYRLRYPYWFQESVHIRDLALLQEPLDNGSPNEYSWRHNSWFCHLSTTPRRANSLKGQITEMDILLEHKALKDHIPADQIASFDQISEDVNARLDEMIFKPCSITRM